jgi:hypothetical protein
MPSAVADCIRGFILAVEQRHVMQMQVIKNVVASKFTIMKMRDGDQEKKRAETYDIKAAASRDKGTELWVVDLERSFNTCNKLLRIVPTKLLNS